MRGSQTFEMPLARLENADLIRRLQELEEVYQFKHNLIQESAYTSLLRQDRRELHRAAAQALERTFPQQLDEHAALLATHYAQAGDDEKTFAYARRAGDAAASISAYAEAMMQYDTAALLATRLPIPTAEFVKLHQQRGRVLELMARYQEAADSYQALYELGKARGEPQTEMGGLLALATLFTFPNSSQNLDRALRVNQQALALAREIHDEQALVRALWNLQLHAYFSGRARESIGYGKQALEIADRLGLREMRAYILNDMSRSLMVIESVSQAMDALADAREIWRETKILPMLADNLASSVETAFMGGHIDLALRLAGEALELCDTIGNLWNASYTTGTLIQIYALRGETSTALKWARETQRLTHASGFHAGEEIAKLVLAGVLGEMGQLARAQELVNVIDNSGRVLFLEGWRLGAKALLHVMDEDLTTGKELLNEARALIDAQDFSTFAPVLTAIGDSEVALQEQRYDDARVHAVALNNQLEALGIRYFVPGCLLREGKAWLGLGELAQAEAALRRAEDMTRQMQARFVLWETLAALAEVETRRGNAAGASTLRAQAREIIFWIADNAPTHTDVGENLRESFLAQRKVQTFLAL